MGEYFADDDGRSRSTVKRALRLLRELFAERQGIEDDEIKRKASDAGITVSTLRKAKRELGIISIWTGGEPRPRWYAPTVQGNTLPTPNETPILNTQDWV